MMTLRFNRLRFMWTVVSTRGLVPSSARRYTNEVRYRGGGNFVDYIKVRLRGGKGGNGAVSFDTSIRQRKGRPSGGNGGKGGDIYIVAHPAFDSLQHLSPFARGENGGNGNRNNRAGSDGKNIILRVPLGVTVR